MTWLLVTRRPFWPSFGALSLFPGIHIAQFPFQVIGNCGVISLMQCSKSDKVNQMARPTKLRCRTVNVKLSREPHRQLSVGAVHNMTVSWRGGLAAFLARPGGEFDDGCSVDRRTWPCVGWPADGRFWRPARAQFRQYPDPRRCDSGMHRDDPARFLDGGSGAEEYCAAAWRRCCGGIARLAAVGCRKRECRTGSAVSIAAAMAR